MEYYCWQLQPYLVKGQFEPGHIWEALKFAEFVKRETFASDIAEQKHKDLKGQQMFQVDVTTAGKTALADRPVCLMCKLSQHITCEFVSIFYVLGWHNINFLTWCWKVWLMVREAALPRWLFQIRRRRNLFWNNSCTVSVCVRPPTQHPGVGGPETWEASLISSSSLYSSLLILKSFWINTFFLIVIRLLGH